MTGLKATAELALTRDQIKAMRHADTAVFRWDTAEKGVGVLELRKEVNRNDGFGPDVLRVEVRTRLGVANHGCEAAGADPAWSLRPAISGSWLIQRLSSHAAWTTMAGQLRPGDTLVQAWVVDNRNELLKCAGLTLHELKVRVERPVASGAVRAYTYMIEAGVRDPFGPADEVKRMVGA
jgi:hypothetical protein